jgi:hypothetical protein
MAKPLPSFSAAVNLSSVVKRLRKNALRANRIIPEFVECLKNSLSNLDAFRAAGGEVSVNASTECGSAPIRIVLTWHGQSVELLYLIESEQLVENDYYSLESPDELVAIVENRLHRLMPSAK